jgi:hypothetical protein
MADSPHRKRLSLDTNYSNIPLLVTSDSDILEADQTALALAFEDAGLSPVRVATPRALWRIYAKTARKR